MSVTLRRTAELLPLVMPYCVACPDFIAEQMLRFAAIDFAERSRAWRHVAEIDMLNSSGNALLTGTIAAEDFGLIFLVGDMAYRATANLKISKEEIEAPTAAVIHEIEFARWNDEPLTPVQFSTIGAAAEGKPRYVTQTTPNAITLYPFQRGNLTVSMFLKPSSSVEFGTDAADPLFDRFNVIPDFFATLHGQTIALGALARILAIPDEPWSNEKMAMQYKAEFEQKLNSAFRWNMRGQQRAPIRTQYRDF